jgi:hypothetical protein
MGGPPVLSTLLLVVALAIGLPHSIQLEGASPDAIVPELSMVEKLKVEQAIDRHFQQFEMVQATAPAPPANGSQNATLEPEEKDQVQDTLEKAIRDDVHTSVSAAADVENTAGVPSATADDTAAISGDEANIIAAAQALAKEPGAGSFEDAEKDTDDAVTAKVAGVPPSAPPSSPTGSGAGSHPSGGGSGSHLPLGSGAGVARADALVQEPSEPSAPFASIETIAGHVYSESWWHW